MIAANILFNSRDIPPRFHGFRLRHCMTREASDLIWRQASNKNIIIRELRQSVWVKKRKKHSDSLPFPLLSGFRKTTEKNSQSVHHEQTFFYENRPPKGGSTNSQEEISFIYSILVYTLPRRPKQRNEKERKKRNENNFYLSYVIVCKIIYSRRKFLFHLSCLFSSSVWLSVLLLLLARSLVISSQFSRDKLLKKYLFRPRHRYTRRIVVAVLSHQYSSILFSPFSGLLRWRFEVKLEMTRFRYFRALPEAHAKHTNGNYT